MKIGVAVPCFIKHIERCYELLESINNQTRLPDQVVVSCSSSKSEDFVQKDYKFPLVVITTEERKNAAQNRNIAASRLETDSITFFDADDRMHPQRLQAIEKAFEQTADIVLHSYFLDKECEQEFPVITEFSLRKNVLSKCASGCIKYDYIQRIHHGQVSVTRAVFKQIQFPEELMYETREDCVFCTRVFSLPDVQTCYIAHPLSKYSASNTCVTEKPNY